MVAGSFGWTGKSGVRILVWVFEWKAGKAVSLVAVCGKAFFSGLVNICWKSAVAKTWKTFDWTRSMLPLVDEPDDFAHARHGTEDRTGTWTTDSNFEK